MAENLGASFTIDVTNLKAGINKANAMIKESESEFKKYAASLDDVNGSQEGLTKKIEALTTKQDLQRKKVNALKEQYEDLIKEGLDPTSQKAINLRTQINNEETAFNKTTTEIKNATTALQNLDSAEDKTEDELKDLKDQTDKTSGGFGAMDVALGNLVSQGITKAIDGFKDLAKFAADAYKAVDEGGDNVIKATGATGKEAEALQESYKNVAKTFKGDFGTIGSVLGEVNTRFGYTGTKLEETTKDFLRFADVTGTDAKTAVAKVSQALNAAGLESKDYSKLLDQMTTASQKSGVSVETLTDGLTKNGASFRAMGFDTTDTIAILSQFEAAGVNTETVLAGMKIAVKNWAKEGKDARGEFEKAVADIQAAPTDVEKTQKAIEIFGSKAGPELKDAISTGRTEYGNFVTDLKNSQGTVQNTYEQTQDAFDDIDIAIQGVKTDFADFTGKLLEDYGPELKEGFGIIGDAIKGVIDFVFTFTESLGETFGELYLKLEKVWEWIKKVAQAFVDSLDLMGLAVSQEEAQAAIREQYEAEHGKVTNEQWNKILEQAGALTNGGGGHFAKGGIVRHATNAIIGEAGAEAVVPLENNTEWIDLLAEKLGGRGVNVYQTNNYANAHSRYELMQSERNIKKAVKAAVLK
jgi:phage-related minor tail protein